MDESDAPLAYNTGSGGLDAAGKWVTTIMVAALILAGIILYATGTRDEVHVATNNSQTVAAPLSPHAPAELSPPL